ncbi:MAG: sugar kinase [Treponema sp.]|nr:sugar kinase [Treponema sp.]
MALFLCADLGTTSLKAALIDSGGRIHSHARIPYRDPPVSAGPGPLAASSWLAAFAAALDSLVPPDDTPPSALIISGGGPTLVPVDAAGESLRPLHWFEGPPPLEGAASLFLPKVKAFMENAPGEFAKTRLFFSPQEWLSWKLGAEPVTVLPHKGYEPYYWDGEQREKLGIRGDLFPPYVTMGAVIGELKFPAELAPAGHARRAGFLPAGVPIVAGPPDFIAALIGTGALAPGRACDRTGSSEGINLCAAERPALDPAEPAPGEPGRPRVLPHAVEGLWNLGMVIDRSGKLLDDYLAAAGLNRRPCGELINEFLASPSHPGKKILETMGRSFCRALDDLAAWGFPAGELVLSGGQSRTPRWNQYKADISGRVLHAPEVADAELAGNAVLGAAALEGGGVAETAAKMIRVKESYYPRP